MLDCTLLGPRTMDTPKLTLRVDLGSGRESKDPTPTLPEDGEGESAPQAQNVLLTQQC